MTEITSMHLHAMQIGNRGASDAVQVDGSARCVRCFLLQLSIYQTPYIHKNKKQINHMNAISQTWCEAGAGEGGRPTCSAHLALDSSALCSPAFSSVARQVLNTARVVGTRDVRRYYRRLIQNNSAASSRRRRNGSLPARRSSRNSRTTQAAAAACKQRRRNILAAAAAAAT